MTTYNDKMFATRTQGSRGRTGLAARYSAPATQAEVEKREAAEQRAFQMMCDSFANEREEMITAGVDSKEAWAWYTAKVEAEAAG